MKTFKLSSWIILSLILLMFVACGGGGGPGGDVATGILSLSLTDASSSDYQAVFVTIDEVQVHLGGNENNPNHWKSVDMPISPLTVDLFDLVNGVREDLGLVDLDVGRYTQMRLIIGNDPNPDYHPFANYVITNTETPVVHELKIPSGYNTGFKVVNGFTINADQMTELILDFDATRSVIQAGSSGQWLLKPTVKAIEEEGYAIIEGRVTDGATPTPSGIDGATPTPSGIDGALVTVQKYNSTAVDPKDKVEIIASTLTDSNSGENGHFKLFVKPLAENEHYYLVAFTAGRSPDFLPITELSENETKPVADLILTELTDTNKGTVWGTVIMNGVDDTAYATLSFRQEAGSDEMIEIKSINILNLYDYNVELPKDLYTLVASTLFGYETKPYSLDLVAVSPIEKDIVF
jgi:hypothetical protein